MVVYRLQIDAIMRDKVTAEGVFDQLITLAPQYLAVGREGRLFEPSSVKIVTSSQDTDHATELSITDPAILADVWSYIASKYPELDPSKGESEIAPSSIRIHDCYHDESPPQPCEISRELTVTPEQAVGMGLPVLGSVVQSSETVKIIDAEFVARVEAAKEAAALGAKAAEESLGVAEISRSER